MESLKELQSFGFPDVAGRYESRKVHSIFVWFSVVNRVFELGLDVELKRGYVEVKGPGFEIQTDGINFYCIHQKGSHCNELLELLRTIPDDKLNRVNTFLNYRNLVELAGLLSHYLEERGTPWQKEEFEKTLSIITRAINEALTLDPDRFYLLASQIDKIVFLHFLGKHVLSEGNHCKNLLKFIEKESFIDLTRMFNMDDILELWGTVYERLKENIKDLESFMESFRSGRKYERIKTAEFFLQTVEMLGYRSLGQAIRAMKEFEGVAYLDEHHLMKAKLWQLVGQTKFISTLTGTEDGLRVKKSSVGVLKKEIDLVEYRVGDFLALSADRLFRYQNNLKEFLNWLVEKGRISPERAEFILENMEEIGDLLTWTEQASTTDIMKSEKIHFAVSKFLSSLDSLLRHYEEGRLEKKHLLTLAEHETELFKFRTDPHYTFIKPLSKISCSDFEVEDLALLAEVLEPYRLGGRELDSLYHAAEEITSLGYKYRDVFLIARDVDLLLPPERLKEEICGRIYMKDLVRHLL